MDINLPLCIDIISINLNIHNSGMFDLSVGDIMYPGYFPISSEQTAMGNWLGTAGNIESVATAKYMHACSTCLILLDR